MNAGLSVLVPTLDEEVNLPECLARGGWAHEVLMVCSRWRDMTFEVAARGRAVRGVV